MRFRHCASLVEAIELDGSEAALSAALAIPRAARTRQPGAIEVPTAAGRRIAGPGSWITSDPLTGAVRVYDQGAFLATHEAVA